MKPEITHFLPKTDYFTYYFTCAKFLDVCSLTWGLAEHRHNFLFLLLLRITKIRSDVVSI